MSRHRMFALVRLFVIACFISGSRPSVLTSPLQSAPSRPQAKFACTEVLGFSQSMQWYGGSAFAGRMLTGQPIELPAGAFLPAWQGRFTLGGAVEVWANPKNDPWDGNYRSQLLCPREQVDRVVFVVSGAAKSVDEWAQDITTVATAIGARYPAVREIVMQPVTGAEQGQCSNVRAASNLASIVTAIDRVAAHSSGGVTAGPASRVSNCSQYSDALGHLTDDGARYVQQQLREFYAK